MKPLERIRALIALSTSSNENEARSAAFQAVKLIREHRVILSLPAAQTGTSFPVPAPVAKPPRKRKSVPARADGWKEIKAKFGGDCRWCGKRINKDSPIYWSKEHGAYHPVCFVKSTTPAS